MQFVFAAGTGKHVRRQFTQFTNVTRHATFAHILPVAAVFIEVVTAIELTDIMSFQIATDYFDYLYC